MGLFLLGVPMAIIGLKMMHNDTKHTINELSIQKPPHSIIEQKKELDESFINIIEYCGVKCDIKASPYGKFKKFGVSTKYNIENVQKGEYGTVKTYLFKIGYSQEAINHLTKQLDDIANAESTIKNNKRDTRIQKYESALRNSTSVNTEAYTFSIRTIDAVEYTVQQQCKQIGNYFDQKMSYNTVCQITMGGEYPNVNHTESWLILEPQGYDFIQYYYDVCSKLNIKR